MAEQQPSATMPHATEWQQAPPAQTKRATATRPFYDNLTPVSQHRAGSGAAAVSSARRLKQPFMMTPGERDTRKTSRSGRALSELDVLQEKHDAEMRQVVPVVADALSAVVARHATLAQAQPPDARYEKYETNHVPGIHVEDYVHRIAEYTFVSPSTMLAALVFLDRLSSRQPALLFTQLNVFKLYFVAVRVASKVVDLRTLNNKNFASVGGIGNRHLNDLETRFLIDLRFDLFLAPREFYTYAQRLVGPSTAVPRSLPAAPSAPVKPRPPGSGRPSIDIGARRDSGTSGTDTRKTPPPEPTTVDSVAAA